MLSSEQILDKAAREGTIDISDWPRVLESVLQKLHHIVYNDFPLPAVPLPTPALPTSSSIDPEVVVASTPPPPLQISEAEAQQTSESDLPDAPDVANDDKTEEPPPSSQSSAKENDAPSDSVFKTPPAPAFPPQGQNRTTPPSQLQDGMATPKGSLPPDLLSSYQSSTRLLALDFALSPPYTIQRLAEMVLEPRKHYRFLPAYLRALDRIVSVSSPVTDFPLPALSAPINGGFLTNGDQGGRAETNGQIVEREGLGSDESLGGALLTPIPWLTTTNRGTDSLSNGFERSERNGASGGEASAPAGGTPGEGEMQTEATSTIEGPNGPGGIETVSVTVNGVASSSSSPSRQNNALPASSAGHTDPSQASTPASPTLSEQSDASTNSGVSVSSAEKVERELREQGGVTQGELLRQEQEAGVKPVAQSSSLPSARRSLLGTHINPAMADASAALGGGGDDRAEEHVHARGPDVIGVEDMGPQPQGSNLGALGAPRVLGTIDMEAAVGRGRDDRVLTTVNSPPRMPEVERNVWGQERFGVAEQDSSGAAGKDEQDVEKDVKRAEEAMEEDVREEAKDADGDVVIADADGREVQAAGKAEITGDLSDADAVDTTTL